MPCAAGLGGPIQTLQNIGCVTRVQPSGRAARSQLDREHIKNACGARLQFLESLNLANSKSYPESFSTLEQEAGIIEGD